MRWRHRKCHKNGRFKVPLKPLPPLLQIWPSGIAPASWRSFCVQSMSSVIALLGGDTWHAIREWPSCGRRQPFWKGPRSYYPSLCLLPTVLRPLRPLARQPCTYVTSLGWSLSDVLELTCLMLSIRPRAGWRLTSDDTSYAYGLVLQYLTHW